MCVPCPFHCSMHYALLEHHHYSTHNTNNVKRILTITAQVAEAFDINKCRESLPSLLPELHELQMEVVTCCTDDTLKLTLIMIILSKEDDQSSPLLFRQVLLSGHPVFTNWEANSDFG